MEMVERILLLIESEMDGQKLLELHPSISDSISSKIRSTISIKMDEVPRAFVIWETLLMEMVERILVLIESEMDG